MSAIEELGLSKEKFEKLYERYNGFNNEFNENKPARSAEDSFGAFLERGSKKILNENSELIDQMIIFSEV